MDKNIEMFKSEMSEVISNLSKECSDMGGNLASDEGVDLNAVEYNEKTDENTDITSEQSENDEQRNEKSILQKGGKRAIAGGMAVLAAGTAPFTPLHETHFSNEYKDYQPQTQMHAYVDDSVTQRLNEGRLVREHFEQTGEAIITPGQLERLQQDNPEIINTPEEPSRTPSDIAAEMGHIMEQGDPVPEHPGVVDTEENDDLDEKDT
jgi:hypothetical protein